MAIDLKDIALLLLFAIGAYWWWCAHAVKEVALNLTRAHCKAMDVQLLDESVVMRGLWLKRDARGAWRIRRSYMFEFTSTGEQRYNGCTVMLGVLMETIQLEPHHLN